MFLVQPSKNASRGSRGSDFINVWFLRKSLNSGFSHISQSKSHSHFSIMWWPRFSRRYVDARVRNARQLYYYDLRTKAFCRDSLDSMSGNHARNTRETKAHKVAFHLPTRSIRQCSCQFHIRVLVPRGLCDDRVRAPSTLVTSKLFVNVCPHFCIRPKEWFLFLAQDLSKHHAVSENIYIVTAI